MNCGVLQASMLPVFKGYLNYTISMYKEICADVRFNFRVSLGDKFSLIRFSRTVAILLYLKAAVACYHPRRSRNPLITSFHNK